MSVSAHCGDSGKDFLIYFPFIELCNKSYTHPSEEPLWEGGLSLTWQLVYLRLIFVDMRVVIDIPFSIKLTRLLFELAVVSYLPMFCDLMPVRVGDRNANLDFVWWNPVRQFT